MRFITLPEVRHLRLMSAALLLCAGLLPDARSAGAAMRGDPSVDSGLETREMLHDGLQRRYRVHRPSRPVAGAGIVFVLHGSNGDGAAIRESLGRRLERIVGAAGFLVAYPDGFERHWNDCRGTADYAANRRNVDDPAFFREIVSQLGREAGVDPRRVFALGMSNGGQMVLRLALEDPQRYAGLAVIAANLPAPAGNDCRISAQPAAIVLFAGSADSINPFHGGRVRVGQDVSRGHVLAAEYTASWFARRAGHEGVPQVRLLPDRDPADRSRAERWSWSAPGKPPVSLFVLHGGGHTVPGSADPKGAPQVVTNRDIDAARESWEFFRSVDAAAAR